MLVLGIESSCDETSLALVEKGGRVVANVVASQVKAHSPYGGVVPELASRQHLENIRPVFGTTSICGVLQRNPNRLSGSIARHAPDSRDLRCRAR